MPNWWSWPTNPVSWPHAEPDLRSARPAPPRTHCAVDADTGLSRSPADPADHRALVERFLAAAQDGDLAGLELMLAADVGSVTDGGGRPGVARRPLRGAAQVARYLAATASRSVASVQTCVHEVNGVPALLAWSGSVLVGVLVPEIADGRITVVRIVADPDKLRFLGIRTARLSR